MKYPDPAWCTENLQMLLPGLTPLKAAPARARPLQCCSHLFSEPFCRAQSSRVRCSLRGWAWCAVAAAAPRQGLRASLFPSTPGLSR